jgi:hypothetical protein
VAVDPKAWPIEMFDWFKRKAAAGQAAPRPRGVMPTYVTSEFVVLGKAASVVRNTYEIRLALFMALQQRLAFVLAVRPGGEVKSDLRAHLERNGGRIQEVTLDEYSVYLGHVKATEEEGDGWVLGDSATHRDLLQALQSQCLREKLALDSTISFVEVPQLEQALRDESISTVNIDGEKVGDALANLCNGLKAQGGFLFVQ